MIEMTTHEYRIVRIKKIILFDLNMTLLLIPILSVPSHPLLVTFSLATIKYLFMVSASERREAIVKRNKYAEDQNNVSRTNSVSQPCVMV